MAGDPRYAGIYAITHVASGMVYIGSAVNISRRWVVHRHTLNGGTHRSKRLLAAWHEHGAAAFSFFVLEPVQDKLALIEREQYWINHYDAANPARGFNHCPVAGSRLGMKMPESAKTKIGAASKGRRPSDYSRQRASEVHKGKTISPEHRAALSAAIKGRKQSPEHVAKRAAATRGRKMSDEQKARVSAAHKGKTLSEAQREAVRRANLGAKRSPETCAKIAQRSREYWARRRAVTEAPS